MTMVMLVGLMIPLLGTMLGSAFVFFMKEEMSVQLQKLLLGFASGVMVAASVWSLLIPAMEMEPKGGFWSVVPAAVGFLIGIGFLLLIDELTPHHFHAYASGWQQSEKVVFAGYTQWCRRAFGSHSGNFACFASYSCSPLYACFCSGSHVLRRRRRVDTRSLQRSA